MEVYNENPYHNMNESISINPTGQEAPPPQLKPSSFTRRRVVIGVIILLFCLLIPLGLYYSARKQVPADILLVSVGENKIYKSTVQKVAEEQYVPSAISQDVLKKFLDVAIERSVLDIEAKKLNIVISENEIDKELQKSGLGSLNRNVIRYKLLKEKIIASQIKSVEAYTIGFWIPSFDYPQKPEYETQRIEGKKALDEIEKKLKNEEIPLDVTAYIFERYEILQPMLALNGYIFRKTKDQTLFTTPKIYQINEKERDKSYTDKELFDILLTIQPNEVKTILRKDGSGGTVIKSVAVNREVGHSSYEEFLNAKKKELVKTYTSL